MQLDPLEWGQIELLSGYLAERRTAQLFGRLLQDGDTYVDVGAHVGFHTLVARRHLGDEGRVIAIDPQPYNCDKVNTNWRLNGFSNILVCIAAAGDRDGMIELPFQAATDRSRLSLCLPGVNDQPQRFRVPLVRLDSLFGQLNCGRVRLLKIDVEGYELEVVRGLGRRIDQVDQIVAEVLDADAPSPRTLELTKMLQISDFTLKTVEGAPWLPGQKLAENNLWACRT
jgi:FkbM family methyltransferase